MRLGAAHAQTVDDYLKEAHDSDPQKRQAALTILKTFPPTEASITALIDALRDKSDGPRLTAIQVLGELHADPQRVVPALVEALDDKNAFFRATAAAALGSFGVEAAPALSRLESQLSDSDSYVRRFVIQALGALAASSAEVQRLIAGRLQDTAPYVRSGALIALRGLGDSSRNYLPQFITALADPSDQVREAAAQAIESLGAAGAPALPALVAASRISQTSFLKQAIFEISRTVSPVPLLIAALDDPENSIGGRVFAAETLGELGTKAQAAMPALLKASKEGSDRIRHAADDALAKINPESLAASPDALSKFIAMLASEDLRLQNRAREELVKAGDRAIPLLLEVLRNDARDPIRVAAARTLGEIHFGKSREPGWAVVSILIDLAANADSTEVQNVAVTALGYVASPLPTSNIGPVIEALTKAITDPKVRASALWALYGLREKAAAAVPAIKETLERAMNSEPADKGTIHLSLQALSQIGTQSPEVVALVIPLLNDKSDPDTRRAALDALGGMPVAESVAALVEALHDPVDWTRGIAAEALAHIFYTPDGRAYAAEVVPVLIEHVKDPADRVRAEVVSALGNSGSAAALRSLIDAMSDASAWVRWRAVGALGNVLHNNSADASIKAAALPVLIRALDDPHGAVPIWAALSLKEYGPSGAPALPALHRVLSHANPNLAQAVSAAIQAIEADRPRSGSP